MSNSGDDSGFVDRKTFDICCIVVGSTLLQCIMPRPLDSLMLPAFLTYCYIKSDRSHVVLEIAYDKAKQLMQATLSSVASDKKEKKKK